MSDVAISVENLSRIYRLGLQEETQDTLAGNFFSWLKAPVKNFKRLQRLTRFDPDENSDDILWALRDVNFEVRRGEVVGIIGRNGAGKSTLLKILSRITEPTSGRVVINGRVGSLLEVGTGFHPELTGRENVYMNGTILGMTKVDIARKFDEIVEFSGVEKFLDTPVKRYSSGMQVRLAFSVAAHLNPEVLIIDEVLAVGDSEFQAKCLGKMESVSRTEGKTVLFVSHNMGAVRNLCSRAVLLRQGTKVYDGEVQATISGYMDYLTDGARDAFGNNPERSGDGRVRFTAARICTLGREKISQVMAGEPAVFEFDYVNSGSLLSADVIVTLYNSSGVPVTHLSTRLFPERIKLKKSGVVRCMIPNLPLPPGQYRVAAALQEGNVNCDHLPNAIVFDVSESSFFPNGRLPSSQYCTVLVNHRWEEGTIQ